MHVQRQYFQINSHSQVLELEAVSGRTQFSCVLQDCCHPWLKSLAASLALNGESALLSMACQALGAPATPPSPPQIRPSAAPPACRLSAPLLPHSAPSLQRTCLHSSCDACLLARWLPRPEAVAKQSRGSTRAWTQACHMARSPELPFGRTHEATGPLGVMKMR